MQNLGLKTLVCLRIRSPRFAAGFLRHQTGKAALLYHCFEHLQSAGRAADSLGTFLLSGWDTGSRRLSCGQISDCSLDRGCSEPVEADSEIDGSILCAAHRLDSFYFKHVPMLISFVETQCVTNHCID